MRPGLRLAEAEAPTRGVGGACRARSQSRADRRGSRRLTILAVARQVFLDAGYSAASMSMIAERLGGSKGTLYNYFKCKEELFAACIEDGWATVAPSANEDDPDDAPMAATLKRLGEALLARASSDWWADNFRVVAAEARRAHDLAETLYNVGPAADRERLVRFLERVARRGRLTIADPGLAAEHFIGLCCGDLVFRRMLDLAPPPTVEQIRLRVAAAVDAFLLAHQPEATDRP